MSETMTMKRKMKSWIGFVWQVGKITPKILLQNFFFLFLALAILVFFEAFLFIGLGAIDAPKGLLLALPFIWLLVCVMFILTRFALRYTGNEYDLARCFKSVRSRFLPLIMLTLVIVVLLFINVGITTWCWIALSAGDLLYAELPKMFLVVAALFWAVYCLIPYFAEVLLRDRAEARLSGTKLLRRYWGVLALVAMVTAILLMALIGQLREMPGFPGWLAVAIGGVICVGTIAMACLSKMVEELKAEAMAEAIDAFG